MSAALVAGLLAGYGIAVPVGAVGTYLMALTARTSLTIGACAALGIATADGLYALTAMVGGSALAAVIEPIVLPLRWVSALVLVTLPCRGVAVAVGRYRKQQTASVPDRVPLNPARSYFGFLGITMMNPMTLIYFAALVVGNKTTVAPDYLDKAVFVVAAFVASASWQLLLAGGGAVVGRMLAGRRGRLCTSLVSGAVMAVLAVQLLFSPG